MKRVLKHTALDPVLLNASQGEQTTTQPKGAG